MALMVSELVDHYGLVAVATGAFQLDALVVDEVIINSVLRELFATPNGTRLLNILAVLKHVRDVVVVFV